MYVNAISKISAHNIIIHARLPVCGLDVQYTGHIAAVRWWNSSAQVRIWRLVSFQAHPCLVPYREALVPETISKGDIYKSRKPGLTLARAL